MSSNRPEYKADDVNRRVKLLPDDVPVLEEKGYKILKKLGEGGYAKVYACEFSDQKGDGKMRLACKIIDTTIAPKRFLKKFLPRELQCLVKVNHPYIIQVHSIFQTRTKYYIFMRLAEKGDLLEYILRNGAIKQAQARIWARQIALAIQYLHAMEIAHRDIKCENILVTHHNNVKLTDFGFAKYLLNNTAQRELSETFCGSVSYAAPEVIKGDPYNPKPSDLWSFGIVIYTMLFKVNPFNSKNIRVMIENQNEKNIIFSSKYNVSDEAKFLIVNMLEPDITKRYRISQVINSDWIAMDVSLKSLSFVEFEALSKAMDESKSSGVVSVEPYEGNSRRIQSLEIQRVRTSLTYLKEYDEGYNLQLIKSTSLTIPGRLSV